MLKPTAANVMWNPKKKALRLLLLLILLISIIIVFYILQKYPATLLPNRYFFEFSESPNLGPELGKKVKKSKFRFSTNEENNPNSEYKIFNVESEDNWIEVDEELFVYSSFLDKRFSPKSVIRIIGISCSDIVIRKPTCCLSTSLHPEDHAYVQTAVTQQTLNEHNGRKCKPIFICCPITESKTTLMVVKHVALKTSKYKTVLRWMKVRNVDVPVKEPSGLAVCVRPMFGRFRDVFRIAEFVAYYEALGATRFTFYNYDADNLTLKFLDELRRVDFSVEVLPWSNPKPFLEKTWAFGQMASIQDCIYRNMFRHAYVTIVDLDEFITPRKVMTLTELLKSIDSNKNNRTATYQFKSSIFDVNSPKDALPLPIPNFVTQTLIRRQNYTYPFRIRSKYVAKPKLVVQGGIHFAFQLVNGYETSYVPSEDALVNHYRDPTNLIRHTVTGTIMDIIDVSSRKYLLQLMTSRCMSVLNNNTLPQQH